jgi:hypothetical protein
MSEETAYSKARKLFEEIEVGVKISAQEVANRIGATIYEERKKVAAFLSQQAAKGRVKKSMGRDKRMYYEKHAPSPKSPPSKVAPVKQRSKETITLGEIGESIVNYIGELQRRIEKLEKEGDRLREKASIFSKQKEDFKRLYQEAEGKIKELSGKQPVARKTVRLSKVVGD